ncbi:cyclase family protein [Pseudoroseomonas wenyumeiae]
MRNSPCQGRRRYSRLCRQGEEYTYEKHGFVASAYALTTDQYGTQLDPPAHWNPLGATISDLPPTYAIRPWW